MKLDRHQKLILFLGILFGVLAILGAPTIPYADPSGIFRPAIDWPILSLRLVAIAGLTTAFLIIIPRHH